MPTMAQYFLTPYHSALHIMRSREETIRRNYVARKTARGENRTRSFIAPLPHHPEVVCRLNAAGRFTGFRGLQPQNKITSNTSTVKRRLASYARLASRSAMLVVVFSTTRVSVCVHVCVFLCVFGGRFGFGCMFSCSSRQFVVSTHRPPARPVFTMICSFFILER